MLENIWYYLFSIVLTGVFGWSLFMLLRSWYRDWVSMKAEDADWAELDEMFTQLKSAGLWGSDGASPEAKAFKERVNFIYNKWMNQHNSAAGHDYASYRRSSPDEQATPWWEVLGVSKDATIAEIKAAYRALVKSYHPDSAPDGKGNPTKFLAICEAYLEGREVARGRQKPTYARRPAGRHLNSALFQKH